MSTSAPLVPAASSSVTTRSAASPLPMPPGSSATPAGAVTIRMSGSIVTEPRPSDARRGRWQDRHSARVVDAGSVPVRDEDRQDGGVVPAACRLPGFGHRRDQRQRERVDHDGASVGEVDPGDVAVGQEPAPALLDPLERLLGSGQGSGGGVDGDDVGIARHDPEAVLSDCHGCGRPGPSSSGSSPGRAVAPSGPRVARSPWPPSGVPARMPAQSAARRWCRPGPLALPSPPGGRDP